MESKRLVQLINFLQESPEDPFLWFALAKEYEKLEQWEKALQQFDRLQREYPEYIGTYYHYGKLLEATGKAEKAGLIFQEGIQQARQEGDQHALRELQAAFQEWQNQKL